MPNILPNGAHAKVQQRLKPKILASKNSYFLRLFRLLSLFQQMNLMYFLQTFRFWPFQRPPINYKEPYGLLLPFLAHFERFFQFYTRRTQSKLRAVYVLKRSQNNE